MKKLTLPIIVIAVATLSACSTVRDMRAAVTYSPVEPTVSALKPGSGKVATILDPTGPVNGISTQYLTIKMDDGSTQNVVRRGEQIAMGEHVVLTPQNTISRDRFAHRATQ
jgi:uncharacterized protein YceK